MYNPCNENRDISIHLFSMVKADDSISSLASVRRPRTIISIWTFISCVRLIKIQIKISVRGRRTEAISSQDRRCLKS